MIFRVLNQGGSNLCAIFLMLAALSTQAPVYAESSPSSAKGTAPNTVPKADQKAQEKLEVLSLNDLNDTAILLRFIKEQSISIYQEAARLPAGADASAEYKAPSSIPVNHKDKSFLPARQQWLVFYLGIMEPVIRELSKDAAEIESGSKQLIIPDSMKKELGPAWTEWSQNTKQMNKHLDELVPMFDGNPPVNADIQNKAVQIYNDAEQLEATRKKIFACVKNNIKAGGKDKVLISPF